MMRLFLPIAAGIILGGIVHLVTLIAVPVAATADAYTRLAALGPENSLIAIDPAAAPPAPFLDPAFLHFVCRYDASFQPIAVHLPVGEDYAALSFHSRDGVAFFSLNDRSALNGAIDAEIRFGAEDEDAPLAPNAIPVRTPSPTGFVMIRALITQPSMAATVSRQMAEASCQPVE
jgi:uncharacterized membrane protein